MFHPDHVQVSKPNEPTETSSGSVGEKSEKTINVTEDQKSELENKNIDNDIGCSAPQADTALDSITLAATIGEPCMEDTTMKVPDDQCEVEENKKGAGADGKVSDLSTKSTTPSPIAPSPARSNCAVENGSGDGNGRLSVSPATTSTTPTSAAHGPAQVEADLRCYFDFFRDAISKTTAPASDCDGCDPGVDAHVLAHRLSSLTLSTAYSGIGAPEATLNLLHHELELLVGRKLPKHKVLSQVEYDVNCRTVLLASNSKDSPACVFGDLTAFFKPELADTINHLKKRPELALELLAGAVSSGEACNAYGYCYAHSRICHLFLGRTLMIRCCMLFITAADTVVSV